MEKIASFVWLSYGLLLVNSKVMDVLNIMVCTVAVVNTVGIDVVDIVGNTVGNVTVVNNVGIGVVDIVGIGVVNNVGIGDGLNDSPIELK